MLTTDEQNKVFRMAVELVKARGRHKVAVSRSEMTPRRAKQLWDQKADAFRDFLKEVGHVPMPRVSDAPEDVGGPPETPAGR